LNQWAVFQLLFREPEYYDFLTQYEPMAVKLDNPWLLGALYAQMGRCEWVFGNQQKAIQTCTKAAELCDASGNTEGAGFAYGVLQWAHLFMGRFDKAVDLKGKVLRKMEGRFSIRWSVYGICAALQGHAYAGRWDQALAEGEEAIRVAEEYQDDSLVTFGMMYMIIVYA
jgi:tetratricopeptide (TPR) repeat protein